MRRAVQWGLRTALWLLYNEFAWAYDGVSWLVSRGQWRQWQRVVLPHLMGPKVLELGFGTGDLLLDLGKTDYLVCGVERSVHMVRIARRKLLHRRRMIRIVQGCGQVLPFRSGSQDTVVLTFPSSSAVHPRTLREIHRVLRARGRLVMVPLASLHRWDPFGWILGWAYGTADRQAFPSWGEVMKAVGLRAAVEVVELSTSRVQVVVAEKMGVQGASDRVSPVPF
jgi:ubiquinone/menaquinone biosynthesis C-methylase UbiE